MKYSTQKTRLQQFFRIVDSLTVLVFSMLVAYGDSANVSEWRTWTSVVGTKIEAKLIKLQPDSIILENRAGRRLTVPLSKLSEQDRAFIVSMSTVTIEGATRIEGLDAEPGIISEPIVCDKETAWSYHLYLPKDFHDAREWPVWFIMSPVGAKFMNDLRRYIDGAEQLGCILAFSVESKNNFPDSELAVQAMIDDVFDRLPVTSGLAFTTGFSGGSRMAYLLAERDQRIAGVLACGSGHGVYPKDETFRSAELRNSTYVYSLIGTNCCNRTGATKSHLEFPDEYRLRFFSGEHEWANSKYLAQGMARVFGAGLERKNDRKYEKMRIAFAQTMLDWAKQQQQTTPWETYYWADYLKDFPSNYTIENEARSLESNLANNPKVQASIAAEKDIMKFAEDYFTVGYKADQIADIKRKKDATELAEKHAQLPHGILFERFGEPCSY